MATRTAPTVDGSPSWKAVSVTVYDYTGDQRTDTYRVDAAATDIQIEAFVAALQAISNATIWRVSVSQVYNSVGDSSNATEDVWENAKDNLVLLAKDSSDNGFNAYVPAPENGLFLDGTENIDPANVDLGTFMTALLAIKTGFSIVSARFTHRRQIGSKINI